MLLNWAAEGWDLAVLLYRFFAATICLKPLDLSSSERDGLAHDFHDTNRVASLEKDSCLPVTQGRKSESKQPDHREQGTLHLFENETTIALLTLTDLENKNRPLR
ncbi:hypothetical protein BaRGS_00007525 [Batillaria attramentaria]|uniref:Uncharacterized protein n=1 Tax=Batillaria attramentaria TaxID=370345 RepID=A0ABD0LNK9_9CAEN